MDATQDPNGARWEGPNGEGSSSNEKFREPVAEQLSRFNTEKTDEKTQFQKSVRELIRRNGGVRTQRGKERSRRNAVKHGIFAKVVVLDNEPSTQFDLLLQGFRSDFKPEGMVEGLLVEKLAALAWRYRRMLVAERAEIGVEQRHGSRIAGREKQHREEASVLFTNAVRPGPGLLTKDDNPLIMKRCVELLKSLKLSIELRGIRSG